MDGVGRCHVFLGVVEYCYMMVGVARCSWILFHVVDTFGCYLLRFQVARCYRVRLDVVWMLLEVISYLGGVYIFRLVVVGCSFKSLSSLVC